MIQEKDLGWRNGRVLKPVPLLSKRRQRTWKSNWWSHELSTLTDNSKAKCSASHFYVVMGRRKDLETEYQRSHCLEKKESLPFAKLTRIWTVRQCHLWPTCHLGIRHGSDTERKSLRAFVWGLSQAVDWTVGLLLCWLCWSSAHCCEAACSAEALRPLKVGSWPSVFVCRLRRITQDDR